MSPLRVDEYHVGIICALPTERAAARAILDEEHGLFSEKDAQDQNTYFAGRVHKHNVVIASLPAGVDGTNAAASVAADMVRTFKGLRFGLLVGIGGGIPNLGKGNDIRMGDVVVSQPTGTTGGVIQYDKGKILDGGEFQRKGSLNAPPSTLLAALSALQADHESEDSKVPVYLTEMLDRKPKLRTNGYTFPGTGEDHLYQAEYHHPVGNATCDQCDSAREVYRPSRESSEPQVHYGIIASRNQVVRDAVVRDLLRVDCGALCVEMEAAGLMNRFPCLIVRGICDYADSHKNDVWHKYAATTAAAYTKELLLYVSAEQTSSEKPIDQVLDVLKEHAQAVSDHYRKQEIRYQNDQHRKCHVAFKIDNYEQQKDINIDRATGTCQWVLGDEKYITWHQSSSNSLLWISADPGCGKSVLSKSLVDHELPNSTKHTVCYFFFKDNERQDQLSIALCALLHQLFDSQPHLLRYAIPAYEKNGEKLSQEESELWRILLAATADPEALHVTCILDALDECRDDDRGRLIDMLSRFHVNSSSSCRRNNCLKFLVTSRPYDDIQRSFQRRISSLPAIRLRGEDENDQIRKEINMVIGERVSQVAADLSLRPETKTRLEQKLLQMEHRTYLWLYLAIDHIYQTYENSLRPNDESIESLPSSVKAAYRKILEKVASGMRDTVKMILQTVVGARRPLTTGEMALALNLATSSHLESTTDFRIEEDHLERNIRKWCGLFIFINHSKIYLIHQTAREFLVCEDDAIRTGWKHCFKNTDVDMHMSQICIRFLQLKDLTKNISHKFITGHRGDLRNKTENKSNEKVMDNFLLYSAEHWPGHLRSSEIAENDSLMTEVRHLYETTSKRFLLWFRLFWSNTHPYEARPGMNGLRLAAFNGHDKIVQAILVEKDMILTEQDSQMGLYWSALEGHDKVVQMLLDRDADVNAQGGRYGNALQAASFRGHDKVVKMLLDQGADVNAQGGRYGNALQAALWGGYDKVVQMLLDQGADVNAQGGRYGNALRAASEGGHDKVVQMLVDQGADVNAQGGRYGNALQAASWEGHDKVVQILQKRQHSITIETQLQKRQKQTDSEHASVNIDCAQKQARIDLYTHHI